MIVNHGIGRSTKFLRLTLADRLFTKANAT